MYVRSELQFRRFYEVPGLQFNLDDTLSGYGKLSSFSSRHILGRQESGPVGLGLFLLPSALQNRSASKNSSGFIKEFSPTPSFLTMKLSAIFFATAVLFSNAARALPPQMVSRRSARRMNPLYPAENSQADAVEATNTTIQYSGNWSGAVLTSPPAGEIFTTASGTFTVPKTVTASGNGAAAAWVGIDGDTFATAILQAGVYFSVTGDTVEYGAFYEWWPNFATDIPTEVFGISAGDVITINIVATSLSAGTVTLINQTKKTQFSIPQSAPTKLSLLGGQNAEWIVEDYTQNGGIVPLANWGTVNFVNASASTSTRTAVDLSGATIFDIKQFGVVYTDVTIDSGSSVSVAYA